MTHRPEVIFFDLDETLVVNTRDARELFSELFEVHVAAHTAARLDDFMTVLFEHASTLWNSLFEKEESGGEQMTASMARAIAAVGGDPDSAPAMFADFVRAASRGTRLSANAVETLENLKREGITTGLITNGITELQTAKLHRHGLHELLDIIVISELAGAHKPDRAIFEFALEKAGASPGRAWHVGDHATNDVYGAVSRGMAGVYYQPGPEEHGGADPFAETGVSPTHVITDLRQLLELAAAN